MGENKCAFDGCNALEFRATGYCLRHKKDLSDKRNPNITENPSKEIQNASKVEIEWYLFFIGIPFSLFGYRLLQIEPATHDWYGGLINPIVQICGIMSFVVGVFFILLPIFAKFGYRIDNMPTTEFSFDPATGMFYLPTNLESCEEQKTSEE